MMPSDSSTDVDAPMHSQSPHHARFTERAEAVQAGSSSIERDPKPPADGFLRLHPSSLLFGIARQGKALLLPAIFVVFLSRGGSWERWLAIIFIPASLFEIYRYLTIRYRVEADRLMIKQGLLFRRERDIPLARVQNIDVVQNPFHRLFRVAEVRLETAGGSEPEASFKVLALDAVDHLRARVFAERSNDDRAIAGGSDQPRTSETDLDASDHSIRAEGRDAPERQLLRISLMELIKLGLISNRGLALIFIVLGVAWEYDLFDRIGYDSIVRFAEQHAGALGWLPIIVLAFAGLVLLRVLSVSWMILRFFDYRLVRIGEDLRITCGLFTRVTATVPRRRIQLVSVQQTLLQRWIGRASIRIETAGGGGGGDQDSSKDVHSTISRRWFVPTIPLNQVSMILRELRDDLHTEFAEARWEALAPKARRRMMNKALRIALIIVIAVAAIFRPWGFISIVIIVPLALWHAYRAARFLSCASSTRGFMVRSGAWTRRISATFFDKMQIITMRESPFDRRWRMATLIIDTAGAGPAEHEMRVPYLTPESARRFADELATNAERTEFQW